ncbi:malate dehydrogenase, cytoplasmic-like isoform X1 [Hemitrygon akajei]|uniref:malate dehydrogenase, cytoplasmic-like isoform X1 n=1 Tax=Hemitrygon akajei TaxID=2704970 RepID=UPI003BF9BC6B
MKAAPVKVSVTGAAGRAAYSLLYSIANGEVYGRQQPIVLALLDGPSMAEALAGLAMELQDCAFELLRGVTVTHREEVGFREADVALLLDSLPAQEGVQRADLLKANALRFRAHGRALDAYAKKTVKVLVVGDFANTNCLVSMISAPSIPPENFTCLAGLDQTQGAQQREVAAVRARHLPRAASVAKAICDHLRVWWSGTKQGEWVSMGVVSSRNGYGVPDGLVLSFPVAVQDGRWQIIPGLHLSPLLRHRMALTAQELLTQRDMALMFLARSRL